MLNEFQDFTKIFRTRSVFTLLGLLASISVTMPHFDTDPFLVVLKSISTISRGLSSKLGAVRFGLVGEFKHCYLFKKRMAISQKAPFVSIAKEYTDGVDSPPWEFSRFLE